MRNLLFLFFLCTLTIQSLEPSPNDPVSDTISKWAAVGTFGLFICCSITELIRTCCKRREHQPLPLLHRNEESSHHLVSPYGSTDTYDNH